MFVVFVSPALLFTRIVSIACIALGPLLDRSSAPPVLPSRPKTAAETPMRGPRVPQDGPREPMRAQYSSKRPPTEPQHNLYSTVLGIGSHRSIPPSIYLSIMARRNA
jgi:hypothetical protein